jgi:acyl-CoA reductase-like NAD-dependent aldehyde dehydrogenase
MPPADLAALVDAQRRAFAGGRTLTVAARRELLRRLLALVTEHEPRILEALRADLGKAPYEGYLSEVGLLRSEIRGALRRVAAWSRPRRVPTPLRLFPGVSRVIPEPRGVVLIIAPWNYPCLLSLAPLAAALAAGNCAVVKPSELAPRTSAVLAEMLGGGFEADTVAVVEGGRETAAALLEQVFDHIFFTGGTAVGQIVLQAAAAHLTPVTLELGGKSPCIVDASADLPLAARRIVAGKFLNAGQTCIAPDYLLVHQRVRDELLMRLKTRIRESYGAEPALSPDYARIVNDRHFRRLEALLGQGRIVIGGECDLAARYIAPTLLTDVTWQDPVMQEEIFGPLLPVLTFEKLSEAVAAVNRRPTPLAFYLFSRNRRETREVLRRASFGSGCVNDTMVQFASPHLPFGGAGASGMGRYHGRAGFDAFSNLKSVLRRFGGWEPPLRFPPYPRSLRRLKAFLR